VDLYIHPTYASIVKYKNNFTVQVRFESFTAVTMKNAVFWDILVKSQFVAHRKHRSPLHSPAD
jgi:hypothetical protein